MPDFKVIGHELAQAAKRVLADIESAPALRDLEAKVEDFFKAHEGASQEGAPSAPVEGAAPVPAPEVEAPAEVEAQAEVVPPAPDVAPVDVPAAPDVAPPTAS
jgi:hypothetical protein